jgi:hypothetical protein
MCGVVKKIGRAVKKTFKKIAKVVKKVVKSKLFKVVAIGAALYFGGAALFASKAGAAGAAKASTVAAKSAAVGASKAGYTGAAFKGFAAKKAAASAVTKVTGSSLLGKAAGAVASGATKLGAFAQANPLLVSAGLQVGGQLLSGYGAEKQRQQNQEELLYRNQTDLGVSAEVQDINSRFAANRSGGQTFETSVNQEQQPSGNLLAQAAQRPVNTEGSNQQYYDNSANAWRGV